MLVDEEEACRPTEKEKTAAAKTRTNQPAIELASAVASGQCSSRSVDGSDDGSVAAAAAASADALIGLPLTLCVFVIHLTDQTQTHCQS